MSTQEFPIKNCPECNSTKLCLGNYGITCVDCGIVIKDVTVFHRPSILTRYKIIKNHEIFFSNKSTIIGLNSERQTFKHYLLSNLQLKINGYNIKKNTRVYLEIKRIVHALKLPNQVVDAALYLYQKISKGIRAGSRVNGVNFIAPAVVFFTCRKYRYALLVSELLDVSNVDPKIFPRDLLRLSSLIKKYAPQYIPERKNTKTMDADKAKEILRKASAGYDINKITLMVREAFDKALKNKKEQTRIGIVAYVTSRILDMNDVSLSYIARSVNYKPSSLYNSISRVLRFLGFDNASTLIEIDFRHVLNELLGYKIELSSIIRSAQRPVMAN
ncbi:MAG: hypothetical protein ACTSUK_09045 [Promethearchaeota archaeon]